MPTSNARPLKRQSGEGPRTKPREFYTVLLQVDLFNVAKQPLASREDVWSPLAHLKGRARKISEKVKKTSEHVHVSSIEEAEKGHQKN